MKQNTNKETILNGLTELEKDVIVQMFNDCYALDNLDDSFMDWGPLYGKRERGAFASLLKKGVLSVGGDESDGSFGIYANAPFTKRELLEIAKQNGFSFNE